VAQEVAKEAAREHKVLEISQADIVNTIKRMKPSATLASIREYTEFKIDFERRVLGQSLVETSHRLSMGDVIGLDDAKKAVRDAVETPLLHPELVKRYGVSPIKGILLFGPPGNGKTMLMSAILDGIKDATVLQISGSELINEDSSSAINAVRKIFNRAAENTPAVVLVDEIDSITPSRETASEMAIQVTNEFLQQVDGIKGVEGIVIVGATNRPDALDPAILRPGRFDKLIYVRPPSAPERSEMFRYYLKDAPCDSKMDYKLLGDRSNGFTGADINNICREVKTAALRRAVESGNDVFIETQDVIGIIGRVKPSAPAALLDEYKEFLAKYGER
jgi:SpoVK/Ycf46/Vps4 family AAA+-type ATPase